MCYSWITWLQETGKMHLRNGSKEINCMYLKKWIKKKIEPRYVSVLIVWFVIIIHFKTCWSYPYGGKLWQENLVNHVKVKYAFQNPGFFILRIFPNGTLAQNTYACLSWVCLAMLPSTKMKLAMGFVHTLINVEILVLSYALRLSEFCVIL